MFILHTWTLTMHIIFYVMKSSPGWSVLAAGTRETFETLSHRMPQQPHPGSLSAACSDNVTQLHGTAAPAEHLSERFQNNTKVFSLCVHLEFLKAAEKAFSLQRGMLDKMVTDLNKTHYLIKPVKIFDLDKLTFKLSYNYNFYNFFPIFFLW